MQAIAVAGKLGAITLTDTSVPTLTMTAAQENVDAQLLNMITSSVNLRITGSPNNETLAGGAGNDTIDGGGGIDAMKYSGKSINFVIIHNGDASFTVKDNTSTEGTDTLINIARLQFSDTKVALDTGLTQSAGETALLLGAVFGPASITNKAYVGIGLSYLDNGMAFPDLMQLALNAAGATTHSAAVNLLWTNLFGSAPTTAQAKPYIDMLDNGSITAGALGVVAADLALNQTNIHLVGLQQTGLAFSS